VGQIGTFCVVVMGVLSATLLVAVQAATAPTDDNEICADASGDVAIAACTRAIASDRYRGRDLAKLYSDRAFEYGNKGELDRAISDYIDAIRIDPKYAHAYVGRGLVWHAKGDPDRAIADFNEAIRLDPQQVLAYTYRGNTWYENGDPDRAIADFNEAIRLDPKRAPAYNNRGLARRDKGELDGAIADYNEAIRLDPKYPDAYNSRGVAWHDKGELDRAIADFTEAIRLAPKYALAYNNRGNAWREKGDLDRAIADCNEAIRINPKYHGALLNRGLTYLYSGAPAKALADANRASQLDPNDAYNALWVDIVGQRNGLATRLPKTIAAIDMTRWPAPVLRLFLGQSTPQAVLAAADHPNAEKKKVQVCEANFYSGIVALRQGAKNEAARLYRLAAEGCARSSAESYAANAELKQIRQ